MMAIAAQFFLGDIILDVPNDRSRPHPYRGDGFAESAAVVSRRLPGCPKVRSPLEVMSRRASLCS